MGQSVQKSGKLFTYMEGIKCPYKPAIVAICCVTTTFRMMQRCTILPSITPAHTSQPFKACCSPRCCTRHPIAPFARSTHPVVYQLDYIRSTQVYAQNIASEGPRKVDQRPSSFSRINAWNDNQTLQKALKEHPIYTRKSGRCVNRLNSGENNLRPTNSSPARICVSPSARRPSHEAHSHASHLLTSRTL